MLVDLEPVPWIVEKVSARSQRFQNDLLAGIGLSYLNQNWERIKISIEYENLNKKMSDQWSDDQTHCASSSW